MGYPVGREGPLPTHKTRASKGRPRPAWSRKPLWGWGWGSRRTRPAHGGPDLPVTASFRLGPGCCPADGCPAVCLVLGRDLRPRSCVTRANGAQSGSRRERNSRHPRILPGWAVLCRVALGKPLHPSEPHLCLEVTWGREVPVSYLTERARGSHLQHGCLVNVFLGPLAPCAGGSALPPSSETPLLRQLLSKQAPSLWYS